MGVGGNGGGGEGAAPGLWMWGDVGLGWMHSARGEPRSCTQCPPALPPLPPHPPNSPFPHCDLQSCVLGRFVGGGFGPISYTAALTSPPPHGCTPPMPSLWTEGLRPTPRPTLTALLRAPFTPQPFAHPPPNPSFLPPTPTAAFKTNPLPSLPPTPFYFFCVTWKCSPPRLSTLHHHPNPQRPRMEAQQPMFGLYPSALRGASGSGLALPGGHKLQLGWL